MDTKTKLESKAKPTEEEGLAHRRELVRKMGKFALYAAPFTVLAVSNKAMAASGAHGTGPRRHP